MGDFAIADVAAALHAQKPEMPLNKEQRSPTRECYICGQRDVLGRRAYVAATADAPMIDADFTCGVCDGTCANCESPEDLMTEGIAKGLLCERCWSDEVPKWKDNERRRPWYKTLTNPTTAKNRKFVREYVGKLHGVVSKELSEDAQLKLALRVYCKRGRGGQAGDNRLGTKKVRTPEDKVKEHVFLGVARTCLRDVTASRGSDRFSFDLLTTAENQGRRMESNALEAIFLRRYKDVQRSTDTAEKLTELRVLDVSRNLAVAIASRTISNVIVDNRRARIPSYSEEPERFVERVIEISHAWLGICDAHRNLDTSSGRTDESEELLRQNQEYRRELKRQEAELREKREAASKKPKRAPPRERRAPPYVPPVPVSRPNYLDPSTEVTVAGFGEMLLSELRDAVRARGGRDRVEMGGRRNSDECKKWLREYIERNKS